MPLNYISAFLVGKYKLKNFNGVFGDNKRYCDVNIVSEQLALNNQNC